MVRPQRHRTLLHPFFFCFVLHMARRSGVTALFTRIPSGYSLFSTFKERRGGSPNSRNLFSSTGIFNCTAIHRGKLKRQRAFRRLHILKALDKMYLMCYNYSTRKALVKAVQMRPTSLRSPVCVCVYTHAQVAGVFYCSFVILHYLVQNVNRV